jgi:acetyl/propionyl-CoA carboxylase alpha subunit
MEKHVTFLKETAQYKDVKKLTEETPSPFMTDRLRLKMGEAAVKQLKYEGAVNGEFG